MIQCGPRCPTYMAISAGHLLGKAYADTPCATCSLSDGKNIPSAAYLAPERKAEYCEACGRPKDGADDGHRDESVASLVDRLAEINRRCPLDVPILLFRHVDRMTEREIADRVGVSQAWVHSRLCAIGENLSPRGGQVPSCGIWVLPQGTV